MNDNDEANALAWALRDILVTLGNTAIVPPAQLSAARAALQRVGFSDYLNKIYNVSRCPICGVVDGEEHLQERHRVLMAGMPEIEGKILDAIADRFVDGVDRMSHTPTREEAKCLWPTDCKFPACVCRREPVTS